MSLIGYNEDEIRPTRWETVHYLRVVRRLFSEAELRAKEPVILLEKDSRVALALTLGLLDL